MLHRLPLGLLSLGVLGATVLAFAPIGCGSDEVQNQFDAGGGEDTGPVGPNNDGGLVAVDGGVHVAYTDLVISPADAVLTVGIGQSTPSVDYTVMGKRVSDGQVVPVTNGTWDFERFDAASFTQNKLVPTGFVGGVGKVTVKVAGAFATTSATVKVVATSGTAPSAAIIAALDAAADADVALKVIYPYDATVFPRGIPAPLLQWQGPAASNIFRIKAESATFSYTAYQTAAQANGEFAFSKLPDDIWLHLSDSTTGQLNVTVQRYDGTKAYKPVAQTWTIAGSNLKSSVYYTRLGGSDSFVRRIDPGSPSQAFLQNPDGAQCIACHSVSKDGKRVVASINGGPSPWGVWDTKTGQKLYQSQQASGFQAISPDGEYVVWRHWNSGSFGSDGSLVLSKFNNDVSLASMTPPAGNGSPSHPVWSPDGKKLAFGMRTVGNGLSYSAATMWTVDITLGASPGFANFTKIVSPNAQYPVATYPTFSPDSKYIAFMRANKSRGSDADSRGELWVTDITGGTQIRLDKANGGGILANTAQSFGPSFHPIAAGGYYWLAFYAVRNYGHKYTATRPQIWIAAVDANPQPGVDPSHPGFYIAGQETDSTNERPQFAVPPCKGAGEGCEAGYECCDGFCRKDATTNKLVCQKPKPNECAQIGEVCALATDCCDASASCTGGTCQPPIPK